MKTFTFTEEDLILHLISFAQSRNLSTQGVNIRVAATNHVATIEPSKEEEKQEKPLLGLAKTSELIYELSARCDTGSIDKGGNYRTVDGD